MASSMWLLPATCHGRLQYFKHCSKQFCPMQKAIHGITVAHFFETYREKLRMELVTGQKGVHRVIREGTINRPALALTGFFKYFAHRRIQVLGAAELTYLKTRSQLDQTNIFEQMAKKGVPCIVL